MTSIKHKRIGAVITVFAVVVAFFHTALADTATPVGKLYIQHCAECHHTKRLGLTAPPLIPTLYSRSVKGKIADVISKGLPATRMPAFKNKLSSEQIESLTQYIQAPVDEKELVWTDADIVKSRKCSAKKDPASGVAGKIKDFENVTLVMERGTKSLVVLNGADLTEITKFEVGAVHGGPKFSYSLKNVFSVSRDGLVTSFNIPRLTTDCVFKAGINSRSIAVSHDDKIIAVANYLPSNIVFFDSADLKPVHKIELPGKAGGFYSVPDLNGFILSFREIAELWVIKPGVKYDVEKISLPAPFEDFSVSPNNPYIIGTKRGSDKLYIYDYEQKKIIAQLPTSGMPHLASAAFWKTDGKLFAGVNHIKEPFATIISMADQKVIAKIPLPGAGFFLRTHSATRYLWIDTETDKVALVDKNNLDDIRFITPHEGRKAMHVEFTKEGKYALVTIPGTDGEVVVYDTASLMKIKKMPYKRPVGKYNALNKTYPGKVFEQAKPASKVSVGKSIFDDYCMGCHHQVYEAFGPSFSEIADIRSEKEVRAHIISPGKSAEDLGYERNSMSYIKLTNPQLDSIVAYIFSFKEGK